MVGMVSRSKGGASHPGSSGWVSINSVGAVRSTCLR